LIKVRESWEKKGEHTTARLMIRIDRMLTYRQKGTDFLPQILHLFFFQGKEKVSNQRFQRFQRMSGFC
jgi:hypothetical protein